MCNVLLAVALVLSTGMWPAFYEEEAQVETVKFEAADVWGYGYTYLMTVSIDGQAPLPTSWQILVKRQPCGCWSSSTVAGMATKVSVYVDTRVDPLTCSGVTHIDVEVVASDAAGRRYEGNATVKVVDNDFTAVIEGPETAVLGQELVYSVVPNKKCDSLITWVYALDEKGNSHFFRESPSFSAEFIGQWLLEWRLTCTYTQPSLREPLLEEVSMGYIVRTPLEITDGFHVYIPHVAS